MGVFGDIEAWWKKATICEKHGWHPPTQVCRLCVHELMIRMLTQSADTNERELPYKKMAPVYFIKDFKKKGR